MRGSGAIARGSTATTDHIRNGQARPLPSQPWPPALSPQGPERSWLLTDLRALLWLLRASTVARKTPPQARLAHAEEDMPRWPPERIACVEREKGK